MRRITAVPIPLRTTQNQTFTVRRTKLVGSEKLSYVAMAVNPIPKPVQWAFMVFIFTLPFESQELGILTGLLSPARISGMFFFVVYLIYHSPLAKRHFPPIPTTIFGFLAYIIVYVVGGVLSSGLSVILVRLITLVQLFVFLWVASDLLKDQRVAKNVLISYAIGLNILAAGLIFGLLGVQEVVAGRTTVLNEDLNALAVHLGVAVIVSISLYFSSAFKRFSTKLMMSPLIILPLLAIAKTGSRGGLAAFLTGILVLIIPYGRNRWRWRPVLAGILIVAAAGYLVATNSDFVDRWYESYYEGRFANREVLFSTAIEMIWERPFFGWQTESWQFDFRTGEPNGMADPHNLVLYLLLEVGLVGTMPFLIGLWACGRCAWKSRQGDFGYLPLALLTTVIVAGMSVTTLPWKPFWFALALSVGLSRGGSEQNQRAVPFKLQSRAATKPKFIG